MTIISAYEADMSDALYKRFASLASSYLESPKKVEDSAAHVPLENLFRLLEMYRYNAFSDESRAGILAVENQNEQIVVSVFNRVPWHTNVEKALNKVIAAVFAEIPKEQVVDDLEETLRSLTANKEIEPENKNRAKKFFEKFVEELE